MTAETTAYRSRRAILVGAAGGVAAVVASAASHPLAVRATGGNVTLGGPNSTTTETTITNSAGSAFTGVGTGSGTGVTGNGASGPGVAGLSNTGAGVYASSFSDTNPGVIGISSVFSSHGRNTGVQGYSGSSAPASPVDTGVYGSSEFGDGVVGFSNANRGVAGTSTAGIGLYGDTDAAALPAIRGVSFGNGTAVQGYSGPSVPPASPAATGVHGFANNSSSSAGVRGESPAGRGGIFKGGKAQLRLVASTAATHPASGARGDLFVDSSGRLWFCKTGSTWVKLA